MAMRVKGLKQLSRNFRRLADEATGSTRLARAMYLEGELVMSKSKPLVPVDTGALRNSGNVLPPKITPMNIVVELGYGDSAVDYALPVHERLDVAHEVGQAKYLEQPFMESLPGIIMRLGTEVMGVMKMQVRGV